MILCGIFIAFLTGKIDIINEALLIDTQEAVVFAISLVGIMSIWLGLMNIARKSGLIDILAVFMRPITKFLFHSIPPIGIMRRSGSIDIIVEVLAPVFEPLGIPKEVLPLALMRPFSG